MAGDTAPTTDRAAETTAVTVGFEETALEQVGERAVRSRRGDREAAVRGLLDRWLHSRGERREPWRETVTQSGEGRVSRLRRRPGKLSAVAGVCLCRSFVCENSGKTGSQQPDRVFQEQKLLSTI